MIPFETRKPDLAQPEPNKPELTAEYAEYAEEDFSGFPRIPRIPRFKIAPILHATLFPPSDFGLPSDLGLRISGLAVMSAYFYTKA